MPFNLYLFKHILCRRSPTAYKKRQSEVCKINKSKFKSQKRTSLRRKQKIVHLKQLVNELRNNQQLSTTALRHLEQLFSSILQALMRRMLNNHRKGKITRQEYPPELKAFTMTLQFYSDKAYRYFRYTDIFVVVIMKLQICKKSV